MMEEGSKMKSTCCRIGGETLEIKTMPTLKRINWHGLPKDKKKLNKEKAKMS